MSHQLWTTLIRHSITPNQLYFLDCCRYKIKPDSMINSAAESSIAISRGYLTEDGKLTNKAMQVLEEFETYLVKTKKKVATSVLGENFIEKINEYRELFPKERLPSGELARQNVQELKDKFIWFFKTYTNYDWDLVLDATDYYIYSKEKDNYMYMATSSYFIQKTDNRTKVSKSLLADYCQILIDNPEILKKA